MLTRGVCIFFILLGCVQHSAEAQLFKNKKRSGKKVELQSDSVQIEITDMVFTNINKTLSTLIPSYKRKLKNWIKNEIGRRSTPYLRNTFLILVPKTSHIKPITFGDWPNSRRFLLLLNWPSPSMPWS